MKPKILVIEDNEQNMYLVTFILEKHGYQVVQAWDGREGIELARQIKPALILLDIQLPVMDGYAVARELRSNPVLADVPIVAVTSYAMVGDRERILAAGCQGYILEVLLKGHGHEVVSARDGAEALEKARRHPPDMIITDVLMPVMDGFTLCRQWKEDEVLKAIPFVFYTATYTDPKDEEFALSLGAERFIVKPVEPDVFVGMLQEILENHEAGRLVAPHEPVEEETVYFREYNEALIRKLEDKMLQLEESNRALEAEIAERKRAEWALSERMKELTCLYAVNRDMRKGLSIDELLRRIIEHLVPAMQFPEITAPVVELDDRRFTSERYTEGLSHELQAEIRAGEEARGHLRVYYAEEKPFLIPYEQDLIDILAEDLGLWLERKRAEEELRQSYTKLQRALEGTVNVLVSAIEIRDPYTAGHQRGVTQLACAIASEMGLSEEQIEGIRMAGLIHDLGKINVPAEILSKPTQLTELEYGLIKMHPQIGHDVLKTIDFPWPVAQIVLQHHERIDGSGYPAGLSGKDILLEARILGVADVVEAMASHRPYRPSHGIDKALEEMSQNKGVLYDPDVVDACLKLFVEKGFKFEQEVESSDSSTPVSQSRGAGVLLSMALC
jgi:response regulator RpfG family c-di-GMP phosphodiesterase